MQDLPKLYGTDSVVCERVRQRQQQSDVSRRETPMYCYYFCCSFIFYIVTSQCLQRECCLACVAVIDSVLVWMVQKVFVMCVDKWPCGHSSSVGMRKTHTHVHTHVLCFVCVCVLRMRIPLYCQYATLHSFLCCRRSEFLGCMSFAVKHAVKKVSSQLGML